MKKFLFLHWRELKHYYHTQIKKLPQYHHGLDKFFHTKNGRLVVILFLAAMVPITVMGAQQVQNLQQEAANKPICGAAGAENFVVDPQPAMQGQPVTFSLKDGGMVDNEVNGFGNGVNASSCQQSGNNVTCTAKGGFSTADPAGKIKHSTWFSLAGGTQQDFCEYAIQKVAAAPTPRPSGSRNPTTCKASLSAYCKADGTPGVNINWEYPTTATCSIQIKDKQGNIKLTSAACSHDETIYTGIANQKDYTMTAKATGCTDITKTVTTSCGSAATATPRPGQATNTPAPGQATNTPAPGQATNTPAPGQATNTPAPAQNGGSVDSQSLDCRNYDIATGQGKIKLTATYKITGTKCKVGITGDQGAVDVNENAGCDRKTNAITFDNYKGDPIKNGGAYKVFVENENGFRKEWDGNPTMECKAPTPTPNPNDRQAMQEGAFDPFNPGTWF
jgi:hypothetical protein